MFELRGDIAAGAHVPSGVRVLSLKQNPAQEWSDLRQVVMDRLKGENEALIKRLKELEQSGAVGNVNREGENHGSFVPRESWEVVNKEKFELEEMVKQKEKRLLRLQQVRMPSSLPRVFTNLPLSSSLCRSSPPKALNSERQLLQYWDSNLLFTPTDKCASHLYTTYALRSFSNQRPNLPRHLNLGKARKCNS